MCGHYSATANFDRPALVRVAPRAQGDALLTAAAQLNRLLVEVFGALERTAAERECHRHRLTASEAAVLREDVGGPGSRGPVARADVEEPEEPDDREASDVLSGLAEHVDELTVGARVGAGDGGDPGTGVERADWVNGDVNRRRRRRLVEGDAQCPAVAAAVELVVDGQHVVDGAGGSEEPDCAWSARDGLEVALC